MLIGYARFSKNDGQDTVTQVKTLWDAGCNRVFYEKTSGDRWNRPELYRLLDQLRAGDTLKKDTHHSLRSFKGEHCTFGRIPARSAS
ncbi:recombinase family protein [Agrobacterium sp. NPDC089420]|uniref:recombinase family protein n=1 Tax=Agrobacterium sp. NPDC089420 TaxID=3363918 RepID=UPI00384B013C